MKLSVITVNLNNVAGLQKTMESVFAQTFTDYEYIIIDGGSFDGSKELIENNADKLSYWISEKDTGIFNAQNKGIKRALGEYLLFLNSGDHFYNNSVLSEVFRIDLKQDIIYGNVRWNPVISHHNGIFPDTLDFEYFNTWSLPHQASFIRRDLFEKHNEYYDESYKMISDWLFFLLAIYKFNCSYQHVNLIVSVCDTKGLSFSPGSWDKIVEERKSARQKYFAAFVKDFETFYALRNELKLVKMTKGYKMHIKLRNWLSKYWGHKK